MSGLSRLKRLKKPSNSSRAVRKASSPGRAGPSVAKEDVNVANPGKRPREVPEADKPKKKAGKRLMDYTG